MEQLSETKGIVQTLSTPSTGGSEGANRGGLGYISSSSAALAQQLLYEVMDMYRRIVELNGEQQQNSIKAQGEAAQAEAQATRDAGKAAATWGIVTGLTGIGSGLVSYGVSSGILDRSKATKLNVERNELIEEKAPLESINKIMSEEDMAAELGERNLDLDAINERKEALVAGNYSHPETEESEALTREAIGQMKADPEGYAEFRSQIDRHHDRVSRDINNNAKRFETLQQRWTQTGSLLTNLGQSTQAVTRGLGESEQQNHSALASLSRAGAQMAASVANEQGKGREAASQAMNNQIQILEKMEQATSQRS